MIKGSIPFSPLPFTDGKISPENITEEIEEKDLEHQVFYQISNSLGNFTYTDFDSQEELKEELLQYLYYYNHERPHQGIDGKKPIEMINPLPK